MRTTQPPNPVHENLGRDQTPRANSPRTHWARLRFGAVAALALVAVSRCSTISERSVLGLRAPKDEALAGAVGEPNIARDPSSVEDPATRAVLAYRAATQAAKNKRNAEACEGFRSLVTETSLNLPEAVRLLARVRALPLCAPDRALPLAQPPKWLAEENARAMLTIAKRNSSSKNPMDLKNLAVALRDVAPFEKTQKLKIEKLKESLAILDRVLARENTNEPAVATDTTSVPALPRPDAAMAAEFEAERAKTLALLITVAPRFALEYPPVIPVDVMALASDLRNARQFDQARRQYKEIADELTRSDVERLKALDGIRMTYKLQLRTDDFIAASKTWQNFATSHFLVPGLKRRDNALLKVYLDTRIQYARAIWTDHRPADAKKLLLETEKQLKGRIPVHESVLIRARIAEEAGKFDETAQILAQVSIDSLPERTTRARFLWYKGWNLRRLPGEKNKRDAITALDLAKTYEDRHSDQTRDMYWVARLYKELGETESARVLFTDLADFSPFGFYGILAQRELGLPFTSLKTSPGSDYNPHVSSPIADTIRVPIDWFIVLGEHEIGREYLKSFDPKEIWNPSFSFDKKEATLVMYSRLEQHAMISVLLDELTTDDRKRLQLKRPELMFPLPYQTRILEEGTKQNVPPALIYSIMRQESLFNPMARSPADAFGLMQLIPEMASVAAKNLGVEFHGPEDLYDPDKNIAFGTVFLKGLFKKYEGRFILAVAAYNANDRAIQGWVKTRMRPDPLEFIEEIPYDETRTYVKLVMRNFVTYQRRMSSTPVQFPEELLSLPNGR